MSTTQNNSITPRAVSKPPFLINEEDAYEFSKHESTTRGF